MTAEVFVFGKAASENGAEAPCFVVLRDMALIGRELVTSAPKINWAVDSG
jgi:hypothetical protein